MMETPVEKSWREASKDYLMARLEPVRQALKRASVETSAGPTSTESSVPIFPIMEHEKPLALDELGSLFDLSTFERDILLLCAGIELDSDFARLCAQAQGDPQCNYPTFNLALAILPDSYWLALSPLAPLRYWRLIEVETSRSLITSPLRIDERILHYLVGLSYLDRRLSNLFHLLAASASLQSSHETIAHEIVATWVSSMEGDTAELPVIQLCGSEVASKRNIATAIGSLTGHPVFLLPATALPTNAAELEEMLHLWEREVMLDAGILLLDCHDGGEGGWSTPDIVREGAIARLIEASKGPLILSSRERRAWSQRPLLTFDVEKPTADEQWAIWQAELGDAAAALNGQVRKLVSHFSLNETAIHAIYSGVQGRLAASEQEQPEAGEAGLPPERVGDVLWEMCRTQMRPKLESLAQHIESVATWEDLVVPETQCAILQEIAMHVRQRTTVYETWGFASKIARGLGISALFAGQSGVGKTMAAEVLAGELHLDLYRIDLSAVVSKYIGETEKNLHRIFDIAEEAGAILLFDEADALFGKRSEVKDSHDRYANIEISYLLQRMEAYRGLAILTTNMKDVLDTAFLRRIRFIVQFPFPDAAQRTEIWRRIFPKAAPTEGLDVEKLAQLNIPGGNIRNIALNAAFIAADAGEPIRMQHLLRAARHEYAKLEKTLTSAETKGWEL
jgi:ATPase family associated with various cellular activities (AAA)